MDFSDEEWAIILTAARRFRDHDSYVSRDAAIDSLSHALPTHSRDTIASAFDDLCAVHESAVEVVPRHVRRRFKLLPFATRRDIDVSACMAELKEIAPKLPPAQTRHMLDWVIYWHWER